MWGITIDHLNIPKREQIRIKHCEKCSVLVFSLRDDTVLSSWSYTYTTVPLGTSLKGHVRNVKKIDVVMHGSRKI